MPEKTDSATPMPVDQAEGKANDNADGNEAKAKNSGNEISSAGKWWAGIIMIVLTLACCFFIVGFWPDRMPSPKENIRPLYFNDLFHIRLAYVPEPDSAMKAVMTKNPCGADNKCGDMIHLNTILLILVAIAGFLGNMIYVATSFTTYVGSNNFKKSWLLWYCVKPFTASALAIGIYFVFRGGFLNMSDDSTNINLYGVMTLSVLAGLFTDRTTLKLKEVFDVLLRPKEDRPDKLEKKEEQDGSAGDKTSAQTASGKDAGKTDTGSTAANTTATGNTSDSGEITNTEDVVSGGPDQPDENTPFVKE